MSTKVVIAIAAVALLVVCCGAVACTPLGNAVPVVNVDHDSSKTKKSKKKHTTRTRTRR